MKLDLNVLIRSLAIATISFVLVSCNSDQQAATQSVSPVSSGITAGKTPTSNDSQTGATGSYPSCVSSDSSRICIGLKIVSFQNSAGVPVTSEAEAVTLVNGMNAIWAQCNIAFQLEVFQVVDPSNKGISYSPDWQSESDAVRMAYADETRFLVVMVGPWDVSTIAVTNMPNSGDYGTLVDQQYAHNPLTVGHELGHYQGLYHVTDTTNLMSPYIGSKTSALTAEQCATSQNTDKKNWTAMMRSP